MATTTRTAPDIYEDGFRLIHFNEFNRYLDEYTDIFMMNGSTKNNETDSGVGSFGLVPQRLEGAPVVYDDPTQGFDKTYTHLEFALGFQVTRIAREDDQTTIMDRMPGQLGTSLRQTLESDCQNDLNNGFTSGLGGDGKTLFATDHPLPGGGTEQNELTTAADLTQASYEQALIDIASLVDDRGKQILIQPTKLFHHRNNNFNVDKLFMTDKEPGSANNDINPMARGRRGLTTRTLNFLTDPDAWFIKCDVHFMNFFWRRSPDFGRDNDFDTDNWRYKTSARWSHGWSDWYGWYGSPGG